MKENVKKVDKHLTEIQASLHIRKAASSTASTKMLAVPDP